MSCLSNLTYPELGTAQPQLVVYFCYLTQQVMVISTKCINIFIWPFPYENKIKKLINCGQSDSNSLFSFILWVGDNINQIQWTQAKSYPQPWHSQVYHYRYFLLHFVDFLVSNMHLEYYVCGTWHHSCEKVVLHCNAR